MTSELGLRRILVVTDHASPAVALRAAVRERAVRGGVQFRLVVINPARAELHLLHPERHDKAAQAERFLLEALPQLAQDAGAAVIGSVSVRHDPMDAIEETLISEPIDEIMLALPERHLAARFHRDLQHRLAHLDVPVTLVAGCT